MRLNHARKYGPTNSDEANNYTTSKKIAWKCNSQVITKRTRAHQVAGAGIVTNVALAQRGVHTRRHCVHAPAVGFRCRRNLRLKAPVQLGSQQQVSNVSVASRTESVNIGKYFGGHLKEKCHDRTKKMTTKPAMQAVARCNEEFLRPRFDAGSKRDQLRGK